MTKHIGGRWAPICQDCWGLGEPDQYFPEASTFGECIVCDQYADLVNAHPEIARKAVALLEQAKAEADAQREREVAEALATSPGLQGPIDLLPAAFDGYEVALAVEVTDAHGDSYTERVDDPQTLLDMLEEGSPLLLMFTVYGHFPAGGVHAFADAIVVEDGSGHGYEHQRQYALRLAQSIDAGRTAHGILDMTFGDPR